MKELSRFFRRLKRNSKHKIRHANRLSKKSIQMFDLLLGAFLVAIASLVFAYMADWAIDVNTQLSKNYLIYLCLGIPFGLAIIRFLTVKFARFASGSGIPQVIGFLLLRDHALERVQLLQLRQAFWKIPLTFLGLLCGASIGREGPSVQVGAAIMLSWGYFWLKMGKPIKGVTANELVVAGAAGGLAAAFNAPLAGVIFAIEEIGKGTGVRWNRAVLLSVLTAGFIVVAIQGNNPYFGRFLGSEHNNIWMWALLSGLVSGVLGGFFARFLCKGFVAYLPPALRSWARKGSGIQIAFVMGIALALLVYFSPVAVTGTGYNVARDALAGTSSPETIWFGFTKLFATVFSYWAGIPGGIFTPSISTGAGIGALIVHVFNVPQLQNVIVLMSMAAFLAAATQAPLTASVVVMEMTGSQTELFWILLASLFASVVSRQICPVAFYHLAAGRFRNQIIFEKNQNLEKQDKKPLS